MESWDRGTIKELPDVTVKSIEQLYDASPHYLIDTTQ